MARGEEAARGKEAALQILSGLDTSALSDWAKADADAPDVEALLRELVAGGAVWDMETLRETARGLIRRALSTSVARLPALVAPAILLAALGAFRAPGRVSLRAAELTCYLVCSYALCGVYADCDRVVGAALARLEGLCGALAPLLTAYLAAVGRAAGALRFAPMAALAGDLIARGLRTLTPALAGAAAALTIAGNLSPNIRLSGLTSLLKWTLGIFLTGALTVFTGLTAAQGALAKGYDGVSVDAAKMALGSLLPVVGGEVADSLETLLSCAALVRNALGVAGLTLLCVSMIGPVLSVGAAALTVRAAAALAEPLGESRAVSLLRAFSGTLSLLLSALCAGAVLLVVLLGAALSLFGG